MFNYDLAGDVYKARLGRHNTNIEQQKRVILNECEVSQVCMQRFLHSVFEMTKQSFVIGEFCGHRSREAQTEFVPRGGPIVKRANDCYLLSVSFTAMVAHCKTLPLFKEGVPEGGGSSACAVRVANK